MPDGPAKPDQGTSAPTSLGDAAGRPRDEESRFRQYEKRFGTVGFGIIVWIVTWIVALNVWRLVDPQPHNGGIALIAIGILVAGFFWLRSYVNRHKWKWMADVQKHPHDESKSESLGGLAGRLRDQETKSSKYGKKIAVAGVLIIVVTSVWNMIALVANGLSGQSSSPEAVVNSGQAGWVQNASELIELVWVPLSLITSFLVQLAIKVLEAPFHMLSSPDFAIELIIGFGGWLAFYVRNTGVPWTSWPRWHRGAASALFVGTMLIVFFSEQQQSDCAGIDLQPNNATSCAIQEIQLIADVAKLQKFQQWMDLADRRPVLALLASTITLLILLAALVWANKQIKQLNQKMAHKIDDFLSRRQPPTEKS